MLISVMRIPNSISQINKQINAYKKRSRIHPASFLICFGYYFFMRSFLLIRNQAPAPAAITTGTAIAHTNGLILFPLSGVSGSVSGMSGVSSCQPAYTVVSALSSLEKSKGVLQELSIYHPVNISFLNRILRFYRCCAVDYDLICYCRTAVSVELQ